MANVDISETPKARAAFADCDVLHPLESLLHIAESLSAFVDVTMIVLFFTHVSQASLLMSWGLHVAHN